MPNAAIDYEKQEALNMARMQPPKADNFDVPIGGYSDDYFRVPQKHKSEESTENEDEKKGHKELERAGARTGSMKNSLNLAKDTVGLATPQGIFSLAKQINFLSDIPYFFAMGAAMLKDLTDLVLVGSLPGLGTVISLCASIFIFMMMLLVGAGEKRKMATGLLKKGGTLFAGTILEFVPALNFVPIETFTVIVIYILTLLDRRRS